MLCAHTLDALGADRHGPLTEPDLCWRACDLRQAGKAPRNVSIEVAFEDSQTHMVKPRKSVFELNRDALLSSVLDDRHSAITNERSTFGEKSRSVKRETSGAAVRSSCSFMRFHGIRRNTRGMGLASGASASKPGGPAGGHEVMAALEC